ncbi:MAG: nitrate/sulfonate/bicarbonate ABC transporter ATP-binding protein [Fimbriimonas ginsengisoli]|uniref:Nitrate/sulfonate/bicarbonate ABC transporter ATP-binding protein n=1 Tax=Fimbriimonas ginsengisoli TaxID=1005039 RepID=A0A931LR92_FIMGI|nr:nitrate/sulfonate/bicarbonate ABC transporter ATP-binding protein [Fimbriimonas ginsengisoli]
MLTATQPLLRIESLTKTFPRPESGGAFTVLEDVSLTIAAGEVVALLGRSGSGKSTLLRIISGLVKPTKGTVISGGRAVEGPNRDVAMVFQSFALLPWLTVVENVELGLEAQRLDGKEGRRRSHEALRLVGLEGFEKAYPKELSGGMQQRVGFARAFVVRPRVLLLDEPFSSLDVLTAENLRGEIGDLWEDRRFPAESVLLVTHNIEEAIMLADRIVVLSSNPGRVRGQIKVTLKRPRERSSEAFRAMADHVYTIMTNPETTITQLGLRTVTEPLPAAHPGAISGLLEILEEMGGPQDVAVISDRLRMEADDLLPILDAAVLLGFAEVRHGDVAVTRKGHEFAQADTERAPDIFGRQALEFAPLVQMIHESLVVREGPVKDEFFLDILDESYSEEEARAQLDTAVYWGRYAGLYEYDSDEGELRLPDEGTAATGTE